MPAEWYPLFGSYFSISTPHLGISEQETSYLNKGLGIVTGASKLGATKELYLSDDQNPRASFIYRLADSQSLAYFDRVTLFHNSGEPFCPAYSSRLQTHDSLRYLLNKPRHDQVYSEMLDAIYCSMRVNRLQRIDVSLRFDTGKLLSMASRAIPADIVRHALVADYVAWQMWLGGRA